MKSSRRLVVLLGLLYNHQNSSAFNLPHSNKSCSSKHYFSTKLHNLSQSTRSNNKSNGVVRLKSSSSDAASPSNGWKERVTNLLCGSNPQRPEWARDWMPTWLVSLRPTTQLATALLLYIFHLFVLTQHSIPFPFQLIPNERGHFQSIGLDSIAGMATLAGYQYFRRSDDNTSDGKTLPKPPPLLSTPLLKDSPWKNIYKSKYSRFTSFLACCALFQAYFWTGRLSIWWEDLFYVLANTLPITVAMHRSLCVLFGHLSWIFMGGAILRLLPRPQNFFSKTTWYKQTFRDTQWLWWTMGGYFVSSWFFNIADFCNQWLLPVSVLEQAQDSVVSLLINPENNDWLASFVGYIAPCLTAPWWEEVLYRGFLLPALILNMKYKWAVLWSGIIFSVHHLSPTACIPLTILGWTWSILYAKSGNLWTTILVHAMWNTRIFLGSWLGL